MPKKSTRPRKQKQKSKTGRRNRPARSADISHLVRGTCSITNPFCDEANGARWPDNSHTKSVSYDFKAVLNLISDAAGFASQLFGPNINLNRSTGTNTGTSAVFVSMSKFGNVADLTAVSRYRLTSYGFRFYCTLPALTAQGTLHIRLFSPEAYASLGTVDFTTVNADVSYDIPVSRVMNKDVYILCAPLGDEARLWHPLDTVANLANLTNIGWQICLVGVSGAPLSTSGVVSVESFYHYEVINDDSSALQLFAHAPPRNNPTLQAASAYTLENIGNKIEGAASTVDKFFQSKAVKYLSTGLAIAFGGPAAGAASYGAISAGQSRQMIRDVD
jgi:hypothetical protein